jgi:hypothetical protein
MWGTSVPQALCTGEKDGEENVDMIRKFVKYAGKSKTLKRYTLFVPQEQLFEVGTVVYRVVEAKKLNRNDLIMVENLNRCFETIRIIAVVRNKLEEMRNDQFDIYNEQHVQMLESLWVALKGQSREGAGIISPEWASLGFQGSDPTTDFRSMGMLGLQQLHFFATRKAEVAKLILAEFSTPGRSFPFAIIGINLTRLVLEMLTARRLHEFIIKRFGNLTVNCSLAYLEGPSNDADCVAYCVALVHEVYCLVFEEFYLVWVERRPVSIMAFTELYSEVEKRMFEKYPPII